MVKPFRKTSLIRRYVLVLFKLFSALFIGLLFSVIGQALIHYRYFSFFFIFLTVSFAFFVMVKKMGFLGVLLVNLLFILMIVLMKVYIVIADNG